MSDDDASRRTVLRAVGTAVSATGVAAGVAGAASPEPDQIVEPGTLDVSDSSDCYTETECRSGCSGRGKVYDRQCCRQGGGYICEDFQETPFCCTS